MIRSLQTADLNYFKGKIYFKSDDGTQNYLVFQPLNKYFKRVVDLGSGNYIYYWKSKGLSSEKINSIITSNYGITPELNYLGDKIGENFNGSCLKQDKIGYTHKTIVNIYIVCEITKNNPISSYPTYENCLFGAVKLTKNSDIDKYKCFGYGIGFDRKESFHLAMGLVKM